MDDVTYQRREQERSKRLLEFVKGEIRELHVEARFEFAIGLLDYLSPEVNELSRKAKKGK